MLVEARSFLALCGALLCSSLLPSPAVAGNEAKPSAASERNAQEDRPGPTDIVVTGHRRTLERTAADVQAITASHAGQYARFETEICPLVLGLARPFAAAAEERMRTVVRTVGLRSAGPGCAPNLTVVIADDGPAVILALQKKMPHLFATISGSELSRLKREPGPLWNWYSIDPKRRDGAPVENISLIAFGPGAPPKPVAPHAFIASNVTLSRLTEPVRLDITLGFVVIGSSAARGLTIAQLGDLGSVAGLSMINPRRLGELRSPSILQLLKADAQARERIGAATEFDIGYLKALYSGDAGYSSEQQAARIAISMTRRRLP